MFLKLLTLTLALLSPTFSLRQVHPRGHQYGAYHNEIDEGIAKFGVNLNKMFMSHYYEGGENILFSPISIYYSLALAHLGGGGSTREEVARALNILATDDETVYKWHQSFGGLMKRLHGSSYTNVSIYNELFLQNGFNIKSQYEDWVNKYYDTKVVKVDFSSNDATDYVNNWFSKATGGKIAHFYDEMLSSDVKLLLANALSFGGFWDHDFPVSNTRSENFHGEDGNEEQVSMMNKIDSVLYYNDPQGHYETVGMPYKNSEYYIYLILPSENESLKHFSGVFNYDHIQHIIGESYPSVVDIKLPLMKLKTSGRIKDALIELGINHLFDVADLSNMVRETQLKVSDIWHYVEMEVDEHGSSISAGTSQEYKIYNERVSVADAKHFYVQRPFMFFIYHPETKVVLFYGSISKVNDY